MAEIIDGKLVSSLVREQIRSDVAEIKEKYNIAPGIAVILVGQNPASVVYVRNKHKACLEVGINSYEINLPETISEADLLSEIEKLNSDTNVHGILVQLPLPAHICENKIINAISPEKDVDAFHPFNTGKILVGKYDFLPCTPAGIMQLLAHYNIDVCGKKCVVVGRSNIVGKPISLLLLEKNATVTICHSKTEDLKSHTSVADIVVVAVGRPKFLTADMVKDGAVVIDVGINRDENGKLIGDVDFNNIEKKASFITPVPGGVGPMTITMLLKNTVTAAKNFALRK